MEGFTFHRKELAIFYWEGLGAHGVTNFRSGLFLTAPRRTGKSTFLREDFIPYVQEHGGLPIIVDLWARPNTDMSSVLTETLTEELSRHSSFLARAAKKTGLSKVSLTGKNVSAEFEPPANGDVAGTLTALIERLHKNSRKPIVLIIDEAQHALQTEASRAGMFALKAARDALNLGTDKTGLFLVFTGSNRDKLAELVARKSQPFYGSAIEKFPLLDKSFIVSYAKYTENISGEKLGTATLLQAFDLLGKKPESLFRVVQDVLGAKTTDKDGAILLLAQKERDTTILDIEKRISALPETQKIVLVTLLGSGDTFSPFSVDTLAAYGCRADGRKMTVPGIQKALDALRDKGFLWRSSYGDYAIEDDALLDWHNGRNQVVGPAGMLLDRD